MSDVQLVVLAGGRATRLGSIAASTPKILVEIAGRPFLDRVLERFAERGVREVVLLTGHLSAAVEAHVARSQPPLPVRVIDELARGDGLRGTAGALASALAQLDAQFVVTYGDSYLDVDYAALHQSLRDAPGALGAMSVYRNLDAIAPSNAAVRDGWVSAYEKHARSAGARFEYIDYGAIALDRAVIESLPSREAIGLDVVQRDLAARGALRAFEVPHRFYEIGSPEGIAELEAHLGRGLA